MRKPFQIILTSLSLLTALIVLNGCGKTTSFTQTPDGDPSSTVIAIFPSPTTTPQPVNTLVLLPNPTSYPTPFIDQTAGFREWLPDPILIEAGIIHDLKLDPFDRDPAFVLYAGGTLIQKTCGASNCDYTSTQLNTKQICSLLNTIELYGFFDYDPASYQTPLAGGEITYINVAAWRNQHIALYQLKDWLEDPNWLDRLLDCDNCRETPEIKPALSETYWLLDGFEISGREVFHPQSLALWLSESDLAGEPVDWTLGTPTLSRLAAMSQCQAAGQRQAVVLTGSEAQSVAGFINGITNQGLSPIFSENGMILQVSSRWLFPYEQAAGCGESTNQFPSADIPPATELMSCRVSDGIIPTATPTPYY
jgi:hypothetical protein